MKKHAKALTLSSTLVIWFIVALTLGSEVSKPFKTFLAGMTGHHWVTKGVLSLVLFFLLYFIFAKTTEDSHEAAGGIYAVVLSAITGGLIIFGFFVWHFLA